MLDWKSARISARRPGSSEHARHTPTFISQSGDVVRGSSPAQLTFPPCYLLLPGTFDFEIEKTSGVRSAIRRARAQAPLSASENVHTSYTRRIPVITHIVVRSKT